ncbi:hypothetical protein BDQ17DRAFT_161563 [Cyathus striatus]|nr:hypothetical protein BDQ17DRAFT_161563 [Cyathus striatus]
MMTCSKISNPLCNETKDLPRTPYKRHLHPKRCISQPPSSPLLNLRHNLLMSDSQRCNVKKPFKVFLCAIVYMIIMTFTSTTLMLLGKWALEDNSMSAYTAFKIASSGSSLLSLVTVVLFGSLFWTIIDAYNFKNNVLRGLVCTLAALCMVIPFASASPAVGIWICKKVKLKGVDGITKEVASKDGFTGSWLFILGLACISAIALWVIKCDSACRPRRRKYEVRNDDSSEEFEVDDKTVEATLRGTKEGAKEEEGTEAALHRTKEGRSPTRQRAFRTKSSNAIAGPSSRRRLLDGNYELQNLEKV